MSSPNAVAARKKGFKKGQFKDLTNNNFYIEQLFYPLLKFILHPGVEVDEQRRRRTETSIQIRKEKKEDQIQKRRVCAFENIISFIFYFKLFLLFSYLQKVPQLRLKIPTPSFRQT